MSVEVTVETKSAKGSSITTAKKSSSSGGSGRAEKKPSGTVPAPLMNKSGSTDMNGAGKMNSEPEPGDNPSECCTHTVRS